MTYIHEEDNEVACCSVDEKANHNHDDHNHEDFGSIPAIISFFLLVSGLVLDYFIENSFFKGWVRVVWYLSAYIPVAYPVIREAIEALAKKDVFNEFFLMSTATIGAFAIGEYPEGVAVMLFYTIGELFQGFAVKRAKNDISALLDIRPKTATVLRNGDFTIIDPNEVEIGEIIQIKVGEKVPLDGILISDKASVNTAALTGESKPQRIAKAEKIMAGSINLEGLIEVKVEKLFNNSSVAKILELVQNATAKKAKTELLIRKLAKVYTPIVTYLAIAVCFLPYFFVQNYVFSDWLYRALIFLVISCPCALVISIPLGYFGGLGAASKNGILFKGAMYMDVLTKVNTLVMDKTGTVTEGTFEIKNINVENDLSQEDFMIILLALESKSTHPIAKAIMKYPTKQMTIQVNEVEEIAGKGLKGVVNNQEVLAGNQKLLEQFGIKMPQILNKIVESIVIVAINGRYSGYVTIADTIKKDAKSTILALQSIGISEIIMLSGDKDSITQQVAQELGIKTAKGGLLPEEKLNELEKLKLDSSKVIAFIGDGINDAPALASSDIGIAMGAMGSDVAIETADIIIQTDEPYKVITAYKISKATQKVIWQNIVLALGVKIIVLILGAMGLATMWWAVFADVGVALLAILNAIRLQKIVWKY